MNNNKQNSIDLPDIITSESDGDLLPRKQCYNNINTNTNTNIKHEHLALNTAFVTGKKKQLCEETSSDLRRPEVLEPQVKSKKLSAAAEQFKKEKDNKRSQFQDWADQDVKALLKRSEPVYCIEVTVKKSTKPGRITVNVDILPEPGTRYQKYVSKMQNIRPYDITGNVPQKHKTWWGYDVAKDAIRDGNPAGKLKQRQTSGRKTRIATKQVPKSIAHMSLDAHDNPVCEIILGDQQYFVQLEPYISTDNPKSMEYFDQKGIWTREDEWVDIDD